MSGSPKRTQASIEEERRLALEEQRRRKAALEAVERDRVARESHRGRMGAIVARVREILNGIEDELRRARRSGVDSDQLHELEEQHRRLVVSADRASDFEAVSRIESQAEVFQSQVRKVVQEAQRGAAAPARAAVDKKATAALATELDQLRRLLPTDEPLSGPHFDGEGRQAVMRAIAATAAEISAGKAERAREKLDLARKAYRGHTANVVKLRRTWEASFHRSRATLEELRAQLDSARADQAVTRWSSSVLLKAETKLAAAESHLAAGAWINVSACVSQAKQAIEAAVGEAQEQEGQELERRYIVKSMLEVLSGSFDCDVPRLVSNEPGSAVVIRARKPSLAAPRVVEICVNRDGAVEYRVEGYDMKRSEEDGDVTATCDGAERDIEEIHRNLRECFGVETSQLEWEGKPRRQAPSEAAEVARQDSRKRGRRHEAPRSQGKGTRG